MRHARLSVLGVCLLAALAAYWTKANRQPVRGKPLRIGVPPAGRVEKTDAEWRALLPAEVFRVTRRYATERPFCGTFQKEHRDGEYRCACCAQPLFSARAKFESGTGWPSFFEPASDQALSLFEDRDGFDVRTEVACSRCDAHLGHVFDDGPGVAGQRYCLNSAALAFVPAPPKSAKP